MELFKAHNQWASRPADETFDSVEAMHAACTAYRQVAKTAIVPYSSLRVEAGDGEIQLVGKTGVPARLTHWAMGQLSQRAGAPAGYLRGLPATLAAQNLNHGLSRRVNDDQAHLLFHTNGSLMLRASVTEAYSRVWNSDLTERVLTLLQSEPHWKLPLAYERTAGSQGFGGLTGKMVPRGAYASDHDMFLFLVDEKNPIEVAGSDTPMKRGFFLWNSEVGASSLGVQTFLYDYVCGNHIVWNARNVQQLRIRHVGDARTQALHKWRVEVRRFSDSSTSDIKATIASAKAKTLGASKDEVIDLLLGKRIPELTRNRLGLAYDAAERAERYGSPRTVWGMVNGLTEVSQDTPHADTRAQLDRAAGKVLQIAF